ncbi:cutinase family protein [Clavibacter michiganensis]|uniref:cutinase family protein n=1 Tax=Clavibacter michiganensis TaxID=28447 RepID=UPI002408F91B|nr:cutinase family protein [Clavibacter michiganensis]MDO4031102.1 cutinase family protein [Clavibacter michiganensis]MDO4080510.1 cutinase family protein [Clavibacter michiganensis]MDO4087349.1 cutinase family protein [Clavibacter michiganensis]MDO4095938.1 cutinase family protein [Clavibacter michiganensis]
MSTLIAVRGSYDGQAGSGTGATPYVYAHGTGGQGDMMAELITAFAVEQNIPVYIEALRYPAVIYPDLTNDGYIESERDGVIALRGEINSLATDCPDTTIQLAGYSQGAHVIGDVLSDRTQLSVVARQNLDGVVLFGDPAYRAGEPWDDSANGDGNGRFARGKGELNAWDRTSTTSATPVTMIHSWCVPDDLFCQSGTSATAHQSYGNASTQLDAFEFLRSFLTTAD